MRFNPRFLAFAREFNFYPRACNQASGWEKGKVERGGVGYVRQNFWPLREFTEAARKAKYQGTVQINAIIDAEGRVRDPKIFKALGLGLDEKAIEAVNKWRFRPGFRNGQPVAVMATIEVNFRLL